MFAVLFEVQPKSEKWDEYLGVARMLKPELEAIDGFVENIRYRSLTRDGWLLSLSTWRDEKALVRWRTQAKHHGAQERGRFEIFGDYHLRVGELDSGSAERSDATEVGAGSAVTLIDARRPADWVKDTAPEQVAAALGLRADAPEVVGWDVFDAVLTPGDVILLITSRDRLEIAAAPDSAQLRQVRILRDYGMFDRREAPQYYPDVARR
ncbi:antibiotic biosynthesis monooxygenase family protein [Dongia sedimenti]|uniref:Antibiotic biosynthesis monooxygenase n=1 Tax=Dongia sedimenti TaxID=3064282 RepID=A0ABU0YK77_9PROT|nr:antibiotic biosynthesis monooxygenase [Rhodospirillaceae bacterium R-7]